MKSLELDTIAIQMMVVVMFLPYFIRETVIGESYLNCLKKYRTVIGLKLYHIHIMLLTITLISGIKHNPIERIIPIICMLWSVYCFITYVSHIQKRVKRHHYKTELCGIIYKSDEISIDKSNLVTNMSNGSTTDKQLSKQLIDYFDEKHPKEFEEIFGLESFLYDKGPVYKRFWKKHYKCLPYDYTAECGLNHISHEFFLLLRESKLQKYWSLKILELFNEDYTSGFGDQKIDNLIRLLSHINEHGKEAALYTSDFLNELTPYIIDAISHLPREEMRFYREVKECYLLNQLFKFIGYTFKKNNDESFYDAAITLNNSLYDGKGYVGQCNIKKHESDIRKILMTYPNELTVRFVEQFDKKKSIL